MLGKRVELPFGIAPTRFTRMMQTKGERAGAAAAAAAGIPFALSTMGTASIEDVAAAAPGGRNWFQLYMWKDRDRSMAPVDRAAQAGYDAARHRHPVPVPVAGARLRDKRNSFTIPPQLTVSTILDALPRPAWWFNFLTTEPLAFASLSRWSGTVAELLDTMLDPAVTYEDLAWIRSGGPASSSPMGFSHSMTPAGLPPPALTPLRCPTTADASSTGRPCPCSSSPTSPARSGRTSRSTSTPGSSQAPT